MTPAIISLFEKTGDHAHPAGKQQRPRVAAWLRTCALLALVSMVPAALAQTQTESAGAAENIQAPSGLTPAPTSARSPFAASVSPGAAAVSRQGLRTGVLPTSPLDWLDTPVPAGVPGAPVIVVVPGALPGPANASALRPGSPGPAR